MNEINEIMKLYAKPKMFSLPLKQCEGEEIIKVKLLPLNLNNLDLLNMDENSSNDEIKNNVTKILSLTLGIEETYVGNLSLASIRDLMVLFKKINKVGTEEMKSSGINSFLAEKRKIAKSKEGNVESNK